MVRVGSLRRIEGSVASVGWVNLELLVTVLRDAVRRMVLDDWDLAEVGVGERTITSHLFRRVAEDERIPTDFRVDHEYNRHGGATKRIRSRLPGEELDAEGERRIFPDIVVHRRGDDYENWLVVEAKRGTACDDHDRLKVDALIEQYGYRYGVLLSLGLTIAGWHPSWEWVGAEDAVLDGPVFDAVDVLNLNACGESNWRKRCLVDTGGTSGS